MHGNQQLPAIFEPHRNWILEHLDHPTIPEAWVYSDGKWTTQTSHHTRKRIEYLEYLLATQKQIGVIRFTGVVNSSCDCTIVYLYDGSVFSHSIFQPLKLNTCAQDPAIAKQEWWIEPWNTDHLLS